MPIIIYSLHHGWPDWIGEELMSSLLEAYEVWHGVNLAPAPRCQHLEQHLVQATRLPNTRDHETQADTDFQDHGRRLSNDKEVRLGTLRLPGHPSQDAVPGQEDVLYGSLVEGPLPKPRITRRFTILVYMAPRQR